MRKTISSLHSDEIRSLKGIDASAARIREAIGNFEGENRELFLCLIDLIGNHRVLDRLNQYDILLEAKELRFALSMEHLDRIDS
jgi:hypothetical protein